MKLRALAGKVIIRRIPRPSKTEGGLYIPETARDKNPAVAGPLPVTGVVVAVGLDVKRCKVGDVVIHELHGGDEFLFEDVYHATFREDEIIGITQCQHEPLTTKMACGLCGKDAVEVAQEIGA